MKTSATIMARPRVPTALRVGAATLLLSAGAGAAGCRDRDPAPVEAVGPPSPECALAGLAAGAVSLVLETTEGPVSCSLDGTRAPRAVAMIVGLAEGRAPFREMTSGRVVRRPYFEGMFFFRAIPGVLVQTGCPVGNGTGHPGYRIPVERDPGDAARLSRPGALFLARYNPPPDRTDPAPPPPGDVMGTHLVVGLTDMSHLAGQVTVLGACTELDTVRRVAAFVSAKTRQIELQHARIAPPPGSASPPAGPCPPVPRR